MTDEVIAQNIAAANSEIPDNTAPLSEAALPPVGFTAVGSLTAAVTNAENAVIDARKPAENEIHHLIHLVLMELGKLEQFTFEEVKMIAGKVSSAFK